MSDTQIRLALSAGEIADTLINRHHRHLDDARILWLFTSARRKKCDRVRLASAKKFSAIERFLSSGNASVETGYDFLGLIDEYEWSQLAQPAREALVDHELCHMAVFVKTNERPPSWARLGLSDVVGVKDDYPDWRYGLRGHDLEEFTDVVQRHGLWSADRKQFAEAIPRQMPLKAVDRVEAAASA